jgi:hypothetical protein
VRLSTITLKVRLFHTLVFGFFGLFAEAQIIFLNNPSSHIVAFNPAFSAIKPGYNHNYVADQATISGRASSSQSDVMATGQFFSNRRNIGLSAHYNYVYQDKSTFQKAGLGLSYHLIFFNEISTGWGVGINYNDMQTDSGIPCRIYNETISPYFQRSTYASVTFGGLINYEKIMAGFSFQPRELIYFTSATKGTFYTTGSVYIKYIRTVTRRINAIFWYNAAFNNIHHLQLINADLVNRNLQSHSLHIHLAGRKGLIGGIGGRVTDFNYISAIAKAGYNFKRCQMLYGIEPYWLHGRYSEIIHELSFTFKLN